MTRRRGALVTGGASGIGRAAALALAESGLGIVVADVDAAGGEETVAQVRDALGDAVFVRLDVTDARQVERSISVATERFGGLDVAFNSAGVQGPLTETAEFDDAEWANTLAVNLTGVWQCMKYEIRAMLADSGGAIVNAASNFGLVAGPRMAAYCASKHGVVGLTKVAALEYASRGIRVNAVCPGAIHTPMLDKVVREAPVAGQALIDNLKAAHPIGRLGDAHEVAAAVAWLCSSEASFVTGAALSVDGGYVAR